MKEASENMPRDITIYGHETNVYGFCSYALYADINFPDRCVETPLLELLQAQGELLEDEILEKEVSEKHPEATKEEVSEIVDEAHTRTPAETLQAMKDGKEFIIGPIESTFSCPPFNLRLLGVPDLMEKRSVRKRSTFGKYCYDIREVKRHKDVKERDTFQAGFYAMILRELQGMEPKIYIETPSGDHEITQLDSLERVLEEIAYIKVGRTPFSFYDRRKCRICGYHDLCYQRLEKNLDISLLPGVGPISAPKLVEVGVLTIPDMVRINLRSLCAKLRKYPYGRWRASKWRRQALAITSKKLIIGSKIRLPEQISYWDIETVGLDPNEHPVIMIDIYNGKRHQQFTAERLRDEPKILEEFVDYVSGTDDCLVSYSGVEFDYRFMETRCRLQRVRGFAKTVPPKRELDLLPELKRTCALPVRDYTLASVGRFFGQRRGVDITGMEVPILYRRYIRKRDKKALQTIQKHIKKDTEAIARIVGGLSRKGAIRWMK